jgi:hypothetical protein
MQRAGDLKLERRLATERGLKFRGTASIAIKMLYFLYNELRELDPQNAKRLRGVFCKGNCY